MNRLAVILILALVNYLALCVLNNVVYVAIFVLFLNTIIINIINEFVLDTCHSYRTDEGYVVKVYFATKEDKKAFLKNQLENEETEQ